MKDLKETYKKIRQTVDKASEGYINTREIISVGNTGLDLKDILILGAICGTDCLFTGKTGSGKTRLANLTMMGLFGKENYTNKTVTPAMQPDDFLDIDFEIMRKGGTLQKAIKPLSIITKPGVVLNEVNRAPGVIQNYLIPFLDKEIDIQGKDFLVGIKLDNDERYQFRIITINEGEDYAVEGMDKALRDRTVIEVPVDMFYQTCVDSLIMLRSQNIQYAPDKDAFSADGVIKDVIEAFHFVRSIELDESVLMFLAYLSGMSYCSKVKSSPPIKESINFSPKICDIGCHFRGETNTNIHNLCGNVYTPSQRALINLQRVARGVAFMRFVKSDTDEEQPLVTIEDIRAAAPFVLYNKIGMEEPWVEKHYQGNRWEAIKHVMSQINDRYNALVSNLAVDPARPHLSFNKDAIEKYAEQHNDVWVYRLAELSMLDKLAADMNALRNQK